MEHVGDYLTWRGDLGFGERPMNDVDNVICSIIAYVNFDGIVGGFGEPSVRLLDVFDRLLSLMATGDVERICSLARIEPALLRQIAMSRRFGEARLRNYVDLFDEGRAVQFSAVTIDLSDEESYVAFRGTDATIVGWREDFMLSFSLTGAQEHAAAYLARVLPQLAGEGRRVYAGGHSKGGNLATYAAIALADDLRPLLAHVWSNDGPGLAPELGLRSAHELYGARYTRIVPAFSIVGMLFERRDEPRLVCTSDESGFLQHDPSSWGVGPCGMDLADELDPDCVAIAEALDGWLASVGLEERQLFTDQLFDALAAGGAQRLDEIASSGSSLGAVARALGEMTDDAKDMAYRLVSAVASATYGSALDRASESATGVMASIRALWDSVSDAFTRSLEEQAPEVEAGEEGPRALPGGEDEG